MGVPKLALPYRGRPILARVAETALAAGIGPVVVVLGADAGTYAPLLRGLPLRIVVNEQWSEGMAGSLHAAVAAARSGAGVERLLVMLADQPGVTSQHLRDIDAASESASVVATGYEFGAGPPALFASESWDALARLRGDEGARSILRALPDVRVVPAAWPSDDVDAPGDYERLVTPEDEV